MQDLGTESKRERRENSGDPGRYRDISPDLLKANPHDNLCAQAECFSEETKVGKWKNRQLSPRACEFLWVGIWVPCDKVCVCVFSSVSPF